MYYMHVENENEQWNQIWFCGFWLSGAQRDLQALSVS